MFGQNYNRDSIYGVGTVDPTSRRNQDLLSFVNYFTSQGNDNRLKPYLDYRVTDYGVAFRDAAGNIYRISVNFNANYYGEFYNRNQIAGSYNKPDITIRNFPFYVPPPPITTGNWAFTFSWTINSVTWFITGTASLVSGVDGRSGARYILMTIDPTSNRNGELIRFLAPSAYDSNDNLLQPFDQKLSLAGLSFTDTLTTSRFFNLFYDSSAAPTPYEESNNINSNARTADAPVITIRNLFPVDSGAIGDPQFRGLSGQNYQIHGIDGGVYSIISEKYFQLNAKFKFLSEGQCPNYKNNSIKAENCWSHPGSYFGSLAFMTNKGDKILVEAGSGVNGFQLITVNNKTININNNNNNNIEWPIVINGKLNNIDDDNSSSFEPFKLTIIDSHHLSFEYSLWSLLVDNSDQFLNLATVSISSWSQLIDKVQPHGLLGQTWKVLRGDQRGEEVSEIAGRVDDYLESNNEIFGHSTMFNKF